MPMKKSHIRGALRAVKNRALTWLFPNRCPYCMKVIMPDEYACKVCKKKLPAKAYRIFAIGGVPCSAALPYLDEYAEAIKRFKFGERAYFAPSLAVVMVRAARECYDVESFDFVTCVPMRREDMRRRGFNQSELLARELSRATGVPYAEALEKHKKNDPQHSLKRSEREKNVRGVFRLRDAESVKGKKILLVDDIITTGNTLGECARILKRGGCQSVDCAVVCAVVV